MSEQRTYTAFIGERRIASGSLTEVGLAVKRRLEAGEEGTVAIFDDETGDVIDLDWRGTDEELAARLAAAAAADSDEPAPAPGRKEGPGRPRLGVVGREVTLLPRHWEWLDAQPGGASATLRRLVDKARREGRDAERARRLREGIYRFMSFMAGNYPGFEEAARALFAGDYGRMEALTRPWPADVRDHLLRRVEALKEAEALAAAHMGRNQPVE